jgi:hypothetical protein
MIYRYKSTFTRPGNATTYSAGDAVCNSDGDEIALVPGGAFKNGRIVGVKVSISNSNTANGTFRLLMFSDDANIPALTDNSAFAMTAAAEEDLIGSDAIALETTGTSGSSIAWDINTGLLIPFSQKIVSGVPQGIYGVLTATAAYDPIGELTVVDVVVFVESNED